MKRTRYHKPKNNQEEYVTNREYANNMNERETGPHDKRFYGGPDESTEQHHKHGRFGDHHNGDFEGFQKHHGMSRTSHNPTKAKNGFHGYVNHPMHFLAGEAGRERIDIHKIKRKHEEHNYYSLDLSGFMKGYDF